MSALARGEALAAAIAPAWRSPQPPPSSPASPARPPPPAWLVERAVEVGAAGLIARSLSPPPEPLLAARRHQAIIAALHARDVSEAFTRLARAGVDAVTAKGWASERLYPERGLRPVADIDLYVPVAQLDAARHALRTVPNVDLHADVPELRDRSASERWRRLRRVEQGEASVQLLAPEDELRLLALHFLKHGGIRPSGLVDVAVALVRRPTGFDWDYLQAGDPRRTEWTLATLGLCERLLGAPLDDTPVARRCRALPPWLPRAILRQWGAGFRMREPLGGLRGASLVAELFRRWPNPVEASLRVGARCDDAPRWPIQLAACARRIESYARLRWRHRGEEGYVIQV